MAVTIEVVLIAGNWDYEVALAIINRDGHVVEMGECGCVYPQSAQDTQEGDELHPGPGGWSVGAPLAEEGHEV